jgi:PAS domain S-box-containing protein
VSLATDETEERFRGYFEQTLVGALVATPDRVLIEANQAASDLLGYSREELLDRTWADLTHPDDVAADLTRSEGVIAGEVDSLRMEKRFVRKDGETIDVDMSLRCLRKPDGSADHLLALFSDVTERRRLERERERLVAEQLRRVQLSEALNAVDRAVSSRLDSAHVLHDVLRLAGEALGCDAGNIAVREDEVWTPTLTWNMPDGFVGERFRSADVPYADLALDERRAVVLKDYRRDPLGNAAVAEELDVGATLAIPLVLHGEGYGCLFFTCYGPPHPFSALEVDFAEKTGAVISQALENARLFEALQRSEAMRATAERIAHAGSFRWEIASQRTIWSLEVLALFDIAPGEFDGDVARALDARVHPDDLDDLQRAIDGVNDSGILAPIGFRVVHRDGSECLLRAEGTAEHNEEGSVTALVGYVADVSEMIRAEGEILRLNADLEERVVSRAAQLEATNKELEAFAYSVSHDLRAPLRAIDGFSAMVAEDAADRLTDEEAGLLQRVRGAAQRMAVLIDDLLGLSRTSRKDLLREDVDLSAVAAAVLEELREAHPDRSVETVVAPGMAVRADPALLRVILVNLLDNAWKFTGKRNTARIEVGVTEPDGERVFFVRDNGVGFDLQYARRLFGAFQRMHTPQEFEGNGIGLATAQRLVTRHGGRIWAEAEVEKDATFYFTLPASTAIA